MGSAVDFAASGIRMPCVIKRLRRRAFSSSSRRTSATDAPEFESSLSTVFTLGPVRIHQGLDTKMIAHRRVQLAVTDRSYGVQM